MSANVFANGREVSAKKSSDQSIAAMPDVCLSPPSPPAGPIPIPYPNFSKASDTSDGTKTVKIAGDEAGMKNQSNYKTSKGDEAATRTLGMGVVTHTIQGKTQFAAWSFDVMFEGANAVRFMDLTTHNHASDPANPPSATASTGKPDQDIPPDNPCKELDQQNKDARNELSAATKDKSVVGPNGNGRGTTVSSGKFAPAGGGASKIWTAHSNQKAHEFCKKRFANGQKKSLRKKGKSNLCPQANHSHAPPAMQKSGHAEARILDEMLKGRPGRPGKITFNIDWRPKKGAPSKMPCEDCHKMICAAQACGIEVHLCAKDGQAKKVDSSHCPANRDSYTRLQETMGEL